jgi:hypothetical protein
MILEEQEGNPLWKEGSIGGTGVSELSRMKIDELVKSKEFVFIVIPAEAGIQSFQ